MTAPPRDPRSGGAFAIIAVIAAVLSIGAALYERSAARRLRDAMVTASRAYEVAQRTARTGSARGAEPAAASRPANPGPGADLSNGPSAGAASAKSGPSLAEQNADWQNFLTLHPEVRDQLSDYAKLEFANEFGAFCQQGGFTTAQADQLEALMFDKWFSGLTIGPQGGIRQTGGDTGLLPPVEQLRGLLGDAGTAKLQDFNRTLPAERVVTDIATKAGLESAPLSSDQAAQLAQAMVANSPEYAAGRSVNPATVDWDATLAQAGAFLSPAQLQAAERQIAGQEYQTALSLARQAAGGPR
jgi:hypothetical protein